MRKIILKTFVCVYLFVHLCVCLFAGMNWSVAMSTGSSPLHILDPTGFEIQLLKSIVKDDAYLPR